MKTHLKLGVALLIGGLSFGAVGIAGATTTWTVVPSANPTTPPEPSPTLSGVDCVSDTTCWAVGRTDSSGDGTTHTLVERSTGGAWSIVPSPTPFLTDSELGYDSRLNDVDCVSATNCWAVGFSNYFTGPLHTLIEHWNGSAWSVVQSPERSNYYNGLMSVSCASASFCMAVGRSSDITLAERWNGTAWSIVPSPNGPNHGASQFNGVSCVTKTMCMAAGTTVGVHGDTAFPLIDRWDGTAWKNIHAADSSFGKYDQLNDVSCATAKNCYAVGSVGDVDTSAPQHVLIEHWSGAASWGLVSSPEPKSSWRRYLVSVSCATAGSCYAIGASQGGPNGVSDGGFRPLMETLSGSSFVLTPTAPTGLPDPILYGMKCTTPTNCYAVGRSGFNPQRTLVEHGS
jgi:hypothetical protein